MKKILIFAAVVSLIAVGGYWSGQKACRMMMTRMMTSQDLYKELGLDAGQAAKLKALDAAFQKSADGVCLKICRERQALIDLMKDKRTTEAALHAKIDAIGRLQTNFEKQTASHVLAVRGLLTPDQAERYLKRVEGQFQQALKKSGYAEYCRMSS